MSRRGDWMQTLHRGDIGVIIPFYYDDAVTVWNASCLEALAVLPEASVDAVVTDPPYLLGFMGRQWDTKAAHEHLDWHGAWCAEAFRVLKPGGHLLAFGGTRTWHRLAVAVEDAGFEIRDSIAWLYGSGFPKSLDVSKAIDKAAGAMREVVGVDARYVGMSERAKRAQGAVAHEFSAGWVGDPSQITAPATPDAERWQGWGTALKPAFEPVVVGRKPLAGTVASNVLAYGTGALNIDACRIDTADYPSGGAKGSSGFVAGYDGGGRVQSLVGRWPANVVLDEGQADELDRQSGVVPSTGTPTRAARPGTTDTGGASRFFPTFRYQAKAPAKERPKIDDVAHPTVKPLELMRWLVRLVTPPGGVVLDPFAGSGTTVEACILEGFRCIAFENDVSYLPMIRVRIDRQLSREG